VLALHTNRCFESQSLARWQHPFRPLAKTKRQEALFVSRQQFYQRATLTGIWLLSPTAIAKGLYKATGAWSV
jgi:hypothetical protein